MACILVFLYFDTKTFDFQRIKNTKINTKIFVFLYFMQNRVFFVKICSKFCLKIGRFRCFLFIFGLFFAVFAVFFAHFSLFLVVFSLFFDKKRGFLIQN